MQRCVTKAGDDGDLAASSSPRLRREPERTGEPSSSLGTVWHQTAAAAACVIVSASVIAGPLPCYFQNHHLYILFSLGVAAFLPLSSRVEERMDFLLGGSKERPGLGGLGGRGGRTRLPASYSRSLEFLFLFWSVCVCVFGFGAPRCKGSFEMMATGNLWGIRSAPGLCGRRLTGGRGSDG